MARERYARESAPAGLSQTSEEPKGPGLLYGWAMIWTLLGIFAGGMALNLTPCVYPLIPITVSYLWRPGHKGRGRPGKACGARSVLYDGPCSHQLRARVIASLTGGLMGQCSKIPLSSLSWQRFLSYLQRVSSGCGKCAFRAASRRLPQSPTRVTSEASLWDSPSGWLRHPASALCTGAPHLGCQHGKPMARVR